MKSSRLASLTVLRDIVNPRSMMLMFTRIEARVPLYCSGMGKAWLAVQKTAGLHRTRPDQACCFAVAGSWKATTVGCCAWPPSAARPMPPRADGSGSSMGTRRPPPHTLLLRPP